MKFGFRIPSLKKRFAARISVKRVIRSKFRMPRGTGFITNPKRALYNRVYNRTSFGLNSVIPKSKTTKNVVNKSEELHGKSLKLQKCEDGSLVCPRCGVNMGQPYTKGIFNTELEYSCPNCNLKAKVVKASES